MIATPTGPEKEATPARGARARHGGASSGALVTACRLPVAHRVLVDARGGRPASRRAPASIAGRAATQPILCAMFFCAAMNDLRAGMAPAPFVDFTQAAPRSPQTLAICGMFGIGTPPTDGACRTP